MYVDTILGLDWSEQGVTAKKWTIPHPESGLWLFAAHTNWRRKVVGYYFVSPVYANLNKEQHKTKKFGKGVKQVDAETFQKLALELPEMVTEKNGTERKVCVVLAAFCAIRNFKDFKYLPAGTTLETGGLNKPRRTMYSFCKVGRFHLERVIVGFDFLVFKYHVMLLS